MHNRPILKMPVSDGRIQNMSNLFCRGLQAEFIKLQGTFLLWFVILVPFAITSITCMLVWADQTLNEVNPWRWYVLFNYRPYFHIFVFLQILFISQTTYLEHRNHTWKNLRVLPVPFWAVFFPKLASGYLILLLNVMEFYLFIGLGGHLLAYLRPELGFGDSTPGLGGYWLEALIPSCKFILASACMVSIMYAVSYYVKSILVSVTVGLVGYVSAFALFLYTSRTAYHGPDYARWHPFNFSGLAFESFGTGNHLLNIEYVYYCLAGGLLIATVHYLATRYRNVT